jgi:hypothetical protein
LQNSVHNSRLHSGDFGNEQAAATPRRVRKVRNGRDHEARSFFVRPSLLARNGEKSYEVNA